MLFAIQALSGLAAQTPEVLFIAGGFGKRRFRPHRTSISRVFGGQAALLLGFVCGHSLAPRPLGGEP